MKRLPRVLITAVLLQACSSGASVEKEAKPAPDPAVTEQPTVSEDNPGKERDPNVRLFDFPATISDESLDRFFDEESAKILSEDQEKTLQLGRLEELNGKDYYILGEFDLSDQFTTRLVLRNSDWTETIGWLANYDPEGRLVDHLEVFYSDNVEGYRSIASRISSESITVTKDTYEYEGENEKVTTTKTGYTLTVNGRFQKKN